MSESAETKICPHCAETIRAAAKVCPRCRTRLERERWSAFRWLGATLPLAAFLAAVLLASWWLRDVGGAARLFEDYRDRLVVSDTTMHYSRFACSNVVSTIGYLRNESSCPWQDVQLEVQYFDAGNRLVDTKTQTLKYQELPAGATEAFRIRAVAAADEADYVSHKVFVRTAKDGRALLSSGD